jgi:phospholipase/carboxylesterase
MRVMAPFRTLPNSKLAGTPILILSALMDPMVPAESAARLAAALTDSGAQVQREMLSAGHGMTQEDLTLAAAFLDKL